MIVANAVRRRAAFISATLFAATLLLYWPVRNYEFVSYDDDQFITENELVQAGITWRGLAWSLTGVVAANWHPLTVWSHMLDCQLFGMNAGAHHLVNALLHSINAALAFLLLRRMTGATGRSAFAAAVFALHPLRVESVAWVAERKDVLSICFALLTLLAYSRYVQRPGRRAYGWSLVFFTLGLLAKPTLVALPVAMLVLDYWPLRRWPEPATTTPETLRRLVPLVIEKWPLFALALALGVTTLFTQKQALQTLNDWPIQARVANSLDAARTYLQQIFWPVNLAVHYPLPPVNLWRSAGSGIVILLVTILAFHQARRRPYLIAGWSWFGITVLPMIGLVQVGALAMADRYTYLPHLGLLAALTWGTAELATQWRVPRPVLPVAGAIALMLCVLGSRSQLAHWKSSETLFRHSLEVTRDNARIHYNLGTVLNEVGRKAEAIEHFQKALAINPVHPEAHNNLGCLLADEGKHTEAISHFLAALPVSPRHVLLRRNLAHSLSLLDRFAEAEPHFLMALELDPLNADVHRSYAAALARCGRKEAAIARLRQALELRPEAATHAELGALLSETGRDREVIAHYRAALLGTPDAPELLNNLAWLLATSCDATVRDGPEAVRLAERACALTEQPQAIMAGTLAAAYAEAGRYTEAATQAQNARALAQAAGETNLVAKNLELLELYRVGRPYHSPKPKLTETLEVPSAAP